MYEIHYFFHMPTIDYILNMFNTGQVTLPKKWREQFQTNKFIARSEGNRLIIEPITAISRDPWERETLERDLGMLIHAENETDNEDNELVEILPYEKWDKAVIVKTKYGEDLYFPEGMPMEEFAEALRKSGAVEDLSLLK